MSFLKTNKPCFDSVNSHILPNRVDSELQILQRSAMSNLQISNRAGHRRLREEIGNGPVIKAIPDELVDILIKYGNNPDGIPALHYAIKCQDEKAVKLLLEHGADPNSQSRAYFGHGGNGPLTAIDFAAAYSTPGILKILIDIGANVNVAPIEYDGGNHRRPSPLHFAVQAHNIENVRVLIERGADKYYSALVKDAIWDTANPPIHLAALLGDLDILKILVQSEKDANFCSPNDDAYISPLISALICGNIDAVDFLLQAGADPNLRRMIQVGWADGRHETPSIPLLLLEFSSLNLANPKVFSLLIDYGLDVNMKDHMGTTLLHSLISQYERWKDHLNAGLEKPKKDFSYLASLVFCMELLLKKGADVEAKDFWNRSALNCANSPEIKALLQKYGAKGV